MFKTFLTALTL